MALFNKLCICVSYIITFLNLLFNRLKRSFFQPGVELSPVRPRCPTFTPSHSQLQQTGSAYKRISLTTVGWDYGEIWTYLKYALNIHSFINKQLLRHLICAECICNSNLCVYRSTMWMICMDQESRFLLTSTSTWPGSWESFWPSFGRPVLIVPQVSHVSS